MRRVEDSAAADPRDLEQVAALDDPVVLYHLLQARDPAVRASALAPLLARERLPEGITPEDVLTDDAAWRAWHDADVLSFAHAW